jgi:hypothetical protein
LSRGKNPVFTHGKSSVCPEENQGEIIHESTLNSTLDYMKKDFEKFF